MIDSLKDRFDKAATLAKRHGRIHLFSHYDADGITSASIVASALQRSGIGFDVTIFPTLGEEQMDIVRSTDFECMIMTDMGTSFLKELGELGKDCIVLDHHEPLTDSDLEHIAYVNCHNADVDGSFEACAATMAYLFAQSMGDNRDLIEIAIAGMIGDKQHIGGFKGINKRLVDEAIMSGRIVRKAASILPPGNPESVLYESIDPYIHGISGDREGIASFLKGTNGSALEDTVVDSLKRQGTSDRVIDKCVMDRYLLPSFGMDAERVSKMVDGCGRMKRHMEGISFCIECASNVVEEIYMGHLEKVLERTRSLVEDGTVSLGHLQYFTSGIQGITGAMAGIYCNYIGDPEKPVIGFSTDGDMLDISSRCQELALENGVNLATVMKECSRLVGGNGGGHANAAGGRIPANKLDEFLQLADRMIRDQTCPIDDQKQVPDV